MSSEYTKKEKREFLEECIEYPYLGICTNWNKWFSMSEGFPELYREVDKRLKRRPLSAYAWDTEEGRVRFLKKFIKQYK